jgi:hypothetical protein
MTLPLLVAGCLNATPPASDAICDGTRQARADLAAALAVSADDRAVLAGAQLVQLIDAGCAS